MLTHLDENLPKMNNIYSIHDFSFQIRKLELNYASPGYICKRRQATNPAGKPKPGDRTKPSKKEMQHPIAPAQTRPKRAFGIARSSNIPIEKPTTKPPSTKSCRSWKPSGALVNPKPTKVEPNKIKKDQHVQFEVPTITVAMPVIANSEKNEKENELCTPMRSTNTVAAAVATSTPYLSAQNCSKCRLDRLESAAYWLAQIRLAESVAKHFVSADFFRLALVCHAQPFRKLQAELKQYVARHRGKSMESLWSDLCKAYGIPNDQINVDFCNIEKTNTLLDEMEAVCCKDDLGCGTFQECDDAHKVHAELPDSEQIEHLDTPAVESNSEEQAEPTCEKKQDGMNSGEDQTTKTPDIESNNEDQMEQQQDGCVEYDHSQQALIELVETKIAESKDCIGEKVTVEVEPVTESPMKEAYLEGNSCNDGATRSLEGNISESKDCIGEKMEAESVTESPMKEASLEGNSCNDSATRSLEGSISESKDCIGEKVDVEAEPVTASPMKEASLEGHYCNDSATRSLEGNISETKDCIGEKVDVEAEPVTESPMKEASLEGNSCNDSATRSLEGNISGTQSNEKLPTRRAASSGRVVGSSCKTPGSGGSSNKSRETSNRIPGKPKLPRAVGAQTQKDKCQTRSKGRAARKSASPTSSVGCKSGEVVEDANKNQRT